MRKIIFALSCLANLSLGRVPPLEAVYRRIWPYSPRALAALLIEPSPSIGFAPLGHGYRSSTHGASRSPPPASEDRIVLTYFDINAMPGDKVRLAFVLSGTPFKDNRISFADWAELKPKTKYGQLPMLEVDGDVTYQSGSMLRWAGRLGSLYPVEEIGQIRRIEEMLGLSDDLNRAWTPPLYMGMGNVHVSFGHPEEWPEKPEVLKKMRTSFLETELPKYMGFLSRELEQTGAFLAGDKPTIADCQWLPQLRSFTSGIVDHIPRDCLKDYPLVIAWMERMIELPEVKQYYEQLAARKK